jgi:hypothetical protein
MKVAFNGTLCRLTKGTTHNWYTLIWRHHENNVLVDTMIGHSKYCLFVWWRWTPLSSSNWSYIGKHVSMCSWSSCFLYKIKNTFILVIDAVYTIFVRTVLPSIGYEVFLSMQPASRKIRNYRNALIKHLSDIDHRNVVVEK